MRILFLSILLLIPAFNSHASIKPTHEPCVAALAGYPLIGGTEKIYVAGLRDSVPDPRSVEEFYELGRNLDFFRPHEFNIAHYYSRFLEKGESLLFFPAYRFPKDRTHLTVYIPAVDGIIYKGTTPYVNYEGFEVAGNSRDVTERVKRKISKILNFDRIASWRKIFSARMRNLGLKSSFAGEIDNETRKFFQVEQDGRYKLRPVRFVVRISTKIEDFLTADYYQIMDDIEAAEGAIESVVLVDSTGKSFSIAPE